MKPLVHAKSTDILSLQETSLFIVGDLILDCYIEGKVGRISPEAPVPVLLETKRKSVPGGSGNVAANAASMGAKAYLCARIGDDSEAENVKKILNHYSIKTEALIQIKGFPTTTKTRVMSGSMLANVSQQIVRIDKEDTTPIDEKTEKQCLQHYKNFIKNCEKNRALVISDYGKGFLTPNLIRSLIELSLQYNIPVVTDPKSAEVQRYAGSTVIKPNLSEGRQVLRVLKPGAHFSNFEEEISVISKLFLQASGCKNLVMSLSEHGVMVTGEDVNGVVRFETRALQVADVSGAGDTLVAMIAMGLAAGLPLPAVTELGNFAAGIVCAKPGTATLNTVELLETLQVKSRAVHPDKIVSQADISHLSHEYQQQKRKIVFTNGCFDILHAGHVDYLQQAKSLGDILIVGLNSDASISRLKGPTRPVQPFEDRASILASLACVDFVLEFTQDTPLELILAVKPNILVKGSDYTMEKTVGAKEVMSWGGEVKHINLLPGRSTTAILKKARMNA